MEAYIRALMHLGDEQCAQRGAELACEAAISSAHALGSEETLITAWSLADEALSGAPTLRRGAAKIYRTTWTVHSRPSARSVMVAEQRGHQRA